MLERGITLMLTAATITIVIFNAITQMWTMYGFLVGVDVAFLNLLLLCSFALSLYYLLFTTLRLSRT